MDVWFTETATGILAVPLTDTETFTEPAAIPMGPTPVMRVNATEPTPALMFAGSGPAIALAITLSSGHCRDHIVRVHTAHSVLLGAIQFRLTRRTAVAAKTPATIAGESADHSTGHELANPVGLWPTK